MLTRTIELDFPFVFLLGEPIHIGGLVSAAIHPNPTVCSYPLRAADNIGMPTYSEDRLAALKSQYELAAREPSNLRYGYVRAA